MKPLAKQDHLLSNSKQRTLTVIPITSSSKTNFEQVDVTSNLANNSINNPSFHILDKESYQDNVDVRHNSKESTTTTVNAPNNHSNCSNADESSSIITGDASNNPVYNKLDTNYTINTSISSNTPSESIPNQIPFNPYKSGTFAGVVATLFGYFFAVNVIYPFCPFMVSSFYPNLSDTELGYYVGYLESAFFSGQICASVIWAKMADYFGRRPIVIIGLIGTLISSIIYGMSINYYMALIIRFLWGVLDGNIGVVTPNTQARLYSIIGLVGGLGRLVGNLVGGWLADININNINYFKTFPYALPCIISGFASFIALLIDIFFLKETKGWNKNHQKQLIKNKHDLISDNNSKDIEMTKIETNMNKKNDHGNELDALNEENRIEKESTSLNNANNVSSVNNDSSEESDKLSACQIFKIHNVWVSVCFYGILAFVTTGFNATFAVWVLNPKKDFGFDWKENRIGSVFAICGPVYATWQIFGYSRVVKKIGFINMAKASFLIYSIQALILPHLALLRHFNDTIVFVVVTLFVAVGFIFRVSVFTCTFAIVNKASPKHRATVNGVGQMTSSLGRIIAPTLLCNLFAWSCTKSNIWPFNYVFSFYIQGIVGIFGVLFLHFLLPKDFEKILQKHDNYKHKKKKKHNKINNNKKNKHQINQKDKEKQIQRQFDNFLTKDHNNKETLNLNTYSSSSLRSIESIDSDISNTNESNKFEINYGVKAMDSQFGLIIPKSPSISLIESNNDDDNIDGSNNNVSQETANSLASESMTGLLSDNITNTVNTVNTTTKQNLKGSMGNRMKLSSVLKKAKKPTKYEKLQE